MNPIFKQGPSSQHRLVLVLFCSVMLMFFDHTMASFQPVRGYLQSLVTPLQSIANKPKQLLNWGAENLITRNQLIKENQQYKLDELLFHEQKMQLDIVKQENDRLRSLLSSPVRGESKKMVAEILSLDSDPYTHQVVINRGKEDGAYEGQPAIDALGVVGQVLHAGTQHSRVILITDLTHAIPVRVKRNGVRLIATGSGNINRLIHNFVEQSADIKVGDLLVTSGLGGKYPEGYPVSEVTFVKLDIGHEYATIYSKPIAKINRLRYMLLLTETEPVNLFSKAPETKSQQSSAKSSTNKEAEKKKVNP
jgi:rod shape-determining protein MreC